jgi:hypothetical protein
MKAQLLAVLLICTSSFAHSQAIKAEDLEKLCIAKAEPERMSCALIVKVYMDGFIEGVAKGVLDTYKFDPEVLAIVKDLKMKDAAPRIGKVVGAATCIQRVSVTEMTDSYLEYVRANPAIRQEHYRKAMTRTIVSKYCGK